MRLCNYILLEMLMTKFVAKGIVIVWIASGIPLLFARDWTISLLFFICVLACALVYLCASYLRMQTYNRNRCFETLETMINSVSFNNADAKAFLLDLYLYLKHHPDHATLNKIIDILELCNRYRYDSFSICYSRTWLYET